jgi:hypothetical protein
MMFAMSLSVVSIPTLKDEAVNDEVHKGNLKGTTKELL